MHTSFSTARRPRGAVVAAALSTALLAALPFAAGCNNGADTKTTSNGTPESPNKTSRETLMVGYLPVT